jgi:hypothetical protein
VRAALSGVQRNCAIKVSGNGASGRATQCASLIVPYALGLIWDESHDSLGLTPNLGTYFRMKLSPSQVREVLGLSPDTFRHWREALPPLAGRKGYRPCFTYGDLLAMAIVRALTEDAGVRIGALHAVATGLFEHCGRHSWAGVERSILVLELARIRVSFFPEPQIPQLDGIGIVVPCRPIVAELQELLHADKGKADQGNLRFPPTVVSTERRRSRAS